MLCALRCCTVPLCRFSLELNFFEMLFFSGVKFSLFLTVKTRMVGRMSRNLWNTTIPTMQSVFTQPCRRNFSFACKHVEVNSRLSLCCDGSTRAKLCYEPRTISSKLSTTTAWLLPATAATRRPISSPTTLLSGDSAMF